MISLKRLKDPVLYSFIVRLVGEDGVVLIERMPDKETTDEGIAEKTEMEIDLVQKILKLLLNKKLVTCRKVKDKKSDSISNLWRLDLDNFDKTLPKLQDPVLYSFIFRQVGDVGVSIIERMDNEETTDERIAEKTEMELNMIRRTLYLLYEKRVATYRRERDEDSGWLTYLWRLNLENFDEILTAELQKFAEILERRLEFEDNLFYICTADGPCCRLMFDDAVEIEFTCPECGTPLEHFNSQFLQERIGNHLTRIRAKVG